MRGQGISFHGPVNSGEAGGRSKPEVVLALLSYMYLALKCYTALIWKKTGPDMVAVQWLRPLDRLDIRAGKQQTMALN